MIGDIVGSAVLIPALAYPNTMGPQLAASKALKAYLENATFTVRGGDAPNREFQLNSIREEWPRPEANLDYPTASIIEAGPSDIDPHNFVPTPLEETLGLFDCYIGSTTGDPKTVLWKEGEFVSTFQVDFLTTFKPEREAIEGALSQLFNPSEERTGVLLEGPEEYFSRNVRATLLTTKRDDSAATAYSNEWRLRCSVQIESDTVSLRHAVLMQRPQACVTVIDPNDPEE